MFRESGDNVIETSLGIPMLNHQRKGVPTFTHIGNNVSEPRLEKLCFATGVILSGKRRSEY